jgi:hypothetical protein
MKTLGKVSVSRRMPPPTQLSSLSKEMSGTSSVTASSIDYTSIADDEYDVAPSPGPANHTNSSFNNTESNQHEHTYQQQPLTIAAVVSGIDSWSISSSSAAQNSNNQSNDYQNTDNSGRRSGNFVQNYNSGSTAKWGSSNGGHASSPGLPQLNQMDFPKLDEAILLEKQQQNTSNRLSISNDANNSEHNNSNSEHQHLNTSNNNNASNGPLLKPSSVGLWGTSNTRVQVHSNENASDQSQATYPSNSITPPVQQQQQPQQVSNNPNNQPSSFGGNSQQQYGGGYNSRGGYNPNYRGNNPRHPGGPPSNYNNNNNPNRKYNNSNYNYHGGQYETGATNGDVTPAPNEINSQQYNNNNNNYRQSGHNQPQRPHLYNRNDALLLNGDDSSTATNSAGHVAASRPAQRPNRSNRPNSQVISDEIEENWATISDRVDYDEKIEFDDEEPPVQQAHGHSHHNNNSYHHQQQQQAHHGGYHDEVAGSAGEEMNEETKKVKVSSGDLAAIERARQRRAEEERRLLEQRQAKCAEKLRMLDSKKQANANANVDSSHQQQQQQQPTHNINPLPMADSTNVHGSASFEQHKHGEESSSGGNRRVGNEYQEQRGSNENYNRIGNNNVNSNKQQQYSNQQNSNYGGNNSGRNVRSPNDQGSYNAAASNNQNYHSNRSNYNTNRHSRYIKNLNREINKKYQDSCFFLIKTNYLHF